MDKKNVLIIDDDINIIKSIELTLEMHSFNVISTSNPAKAADFLDKDIDVVILDVFLGNINGKDILLRIQEEYPRLPVIMISGLASFDEALDCVRRGAFDFIQKPLHPNRLLVSLENAVSLKRMKQQVVEEIIPVHESPSMKAVIAVAEKVSNTDSPVLITGESGTGKDLVARLIHSLSSRSGSRMIKINCGAIPGNLIESELFGHKKGSFTGADRDHAGRIQAASGGSLFLDEIGELPLNTQVKLLRFLENGEIQRIGEIEPVLVRTRIIAATNRDLAELVQSGEFREDLFYRLNVIPLHIPPLRERKDDIPALIKYFTSIYGADHDRLFADFGRDAVEYLMEIKLPGNIRELKNIIERSLILNAGREELTKNDIVLNPIISSGAGKEDLFTETRPLQEAKLRLEYEYIESQLKKFNYSIKDTARALGLLPTNLCRRMRILGIENS